MVDLKMICKRSMSSETMMAFANAYFIIGTAYAGKSTMIRMLAEKYDGILCEENYHDRFFPVPDKEAFPCLCYTRDPEDWHEFIQRTPEEYAAWIDKRKTSFPCPMSRRMRMI